MFNDNIDTYIAKSSHIHAKLGAMTSHNSSDQFSRPSPGSGVMVGGLVTFYGVVALIAITSNVFILITILRRLVPRSTVNVFLASLAVSDMIMVLLSLFDCFAFLNGGWIFGTWTCKIQSLLIEICFTSSTLTLVAVSCERYLLICHPHMKRRTMKTIYIIVLIVWLSAFVICSPLLHGYIVYRDIHDEEKTEELVCANNGWERKYQRMFYTLYSLVTYLIPLFIMGFAHWRISARVKGKRPSTLLLANQNGGKKESVCYTIREESSGGHSDTTAESNEIKRKNSAPNSKTLLSALKRKASTIDKEQHRGQRRMKAIRLLFVVTVFFISLWTPFVVLRLLLLSGVNLNEYLYKFSEVLILSSTAVNGFIYAFMSPPFRKAFKAIICCKNRRNILLSRDSGPSMSNSEDNKFSNRMSRNSIFSNGASESRNGTMNSQRKFSIGNKTPV